MRKRQKKMPRTFSYDVNLREKYLVEENEREGGERKGNEERKSSLIVSKILKRYKCGSEIYATLCGKSVYVTPLFELS